MKLRSFYLIFGLAIFGLISLNYSSGPATILGQGYTGAPGDNTGCTGAGCHADNNSFNSVISLVLSDAAGPVTAYIPDSLYDITWTVNADGAAGYGFQSVCLNSSDSDLAGWENLGSNVKSVSAGGRTYVEHNGGISSSNTFTGKWRAPAAGTGKITFYAVGNAVNSAGGNSGDDPTETISVDVTEDVTSSIRTDFALGLSLTLYPNPVQEYLNLDFGKSLQGDYQVEIIDELGRIVSTQQLENPSSQEQINVADLATGAYFLRLNDGEKYMTKRFVK